jgi:hypothetical protein
MQSIAALVTQQPQAEAVSGEAGSTVLMELLSNSYHTLTETVHRDNLDVLHELSNHQLSEPVAR